MSVNGLEERLVAWRRQLHRYPEVAYTERRTAAFAAQTLSGFPGLELLRPTETSVVAVLKGAKPGRTIALRADMDALPISEESGAEYASRNPGVMHACGHDAHTAMLLGTAETLAAEREGLSGEIRFIFQHAEEILPGGASDIVAAGILDGVDAVVGAHVVPHLSAGKIGIVYGPAMASPDTFDIEIRGKGGHGALPHTTVDPIAIGAQIVANLQQVVSRVVDPLERAVVSVTQFHAGTTFNVIPQSARLNGTVRTFKGSVRDVVRSAMKRIAEGVAAANGAECVFSYGDSFPPVDNDDNVTAVVERAVKAELGEDAAVPMAPLMAGEDFANYLEKAPGCFYFIGVGNEERGIVHPLHHPRFDIDERALPVGVRAMCAAARALLAE